MKEQQTLAVRSDGETSSGVEIRVVGGRARAWLEISGESASALESWLAVSEPSIEAWLSSYGAIRFRGVGLDSPDALHRFASALCTDFPSFAEESSPRHRIGAKVMSSTDYPAEYPIQMHCEYSYAAEWPMKLLFGCMNPGTRGGATPLASTRAVLQRLSPSTQAAFRSRDIMYVRNYRKGIGVSWQQAFNSADRANVEQACRAAGIKVEWLPGNALRTRQVSSAIVRHPRTGEEVWFNHAWFFNLASLEPPEVREFFREEGEDALASQTYFGDGSPIPDDLLHELGAAFAAEKYCFQWEQGDVLLIDNMLTAHGREPFAGPRRVGVVMAEKFRRADLR